MVICPVALAVGCRKCPVFAVCPVKSVIGDYKPETPPAPQAAAKAASTRGKPGKKAASSKAPAAEPSKRRSSPRRSH
ncbi:hypothetical protein DFR29_102475 [Tahibacter aquaticus]|jgi:hypothetical protein|uniref:Uncharacterized protein n=1 Tax=Tahibacter aquaticus TaxID=520092 RepID=A0A4R6Z7N2_9GAMM|nr:hypothetical protein [Tahibacter aquaticus]TDR47813.1 hypothetical protein DFR29_102475 [Tahibacter aquaticus]